MVLWEITLGTAYFLGLKRTYKLALKIQRKIISPKHPKIRQFVQRRTRSIFDVALRVHLKIQERDIEVGRNLGNWILRWLDKMKPSAQIGGPPPGSNTNTTNMTKQSKNSGNNGNFPKHRSRNGDRESGRHLFTAVHSMMRPMRPAGSNVQYRQDGTGGAELFTAVHNMMRPMRPSGSNVQYRQYGSGGAELFTVNYGKFGFGEVVRNDIRQWILHH